MDEQNSKDKKEKKHIGDSVEAKGNRKSQLEEKERQELRRK